MVKRYSLDEYHALIESGELDETPRLELLEGRLVQKPSSSPAHSVATSLVSRFLEHAKLSGTFVHLHAPITLPTSEPKPDLSLIRGKTYAITLNVTPMCAPYPCSQGETHNASRTEQRIPSEADTRPKATVGVEPGKRCIAPRRSLEPINAATNHPAITSLTVQLE